MSEFGGISMMHKTCATCTLHWFVNFEPRRRNRGTCTYTLKAHFSEDIELNSDIPFFATIIAPITYVGNSSDPAGEKQVAGS